MSNYLYYTIYKTTQISTGKYYIGQHSTNDLNDGYMGSGTDFTIALKKHGHKDFRKEILYVFDNEKEMDKMEIFLVNETVVDDPMSFNMLLGGLRGWNLNHKRSQKIVDKMLKNRKFTEETIKKISYNSSNRSLETKQKLSVAAKKYSHLKKKDYKIYYEDGTSEIVHGLSEFCENNDYNIQALYRIKYGTRKRHKDIVGIEFLGKLQRKTPRF